MIHATVRTVVSHRLKQPYRSKGIDQQRFWRSRPRFAGTRLRGEIIDLIRPGILDGRCDIHSFGHITEEHVYSVGEMTCAIWTIPAFVASKSKYSIAFVEQPFGQEGSILARDPRNQRPLQDSIRCPTLIDKEA